MTTATEVERPTLSADGPFPITSDLYFEMVERGLIPEERRVYLWDGRLYEKMAKTQAHAGLHMTLLAEVSRRLPPDFSISTENPVRLDERHTPLPDLVVLRGEPLGYVTLPRYPDHREVVLVAEVSVTSLSKDLGERLSRYAATLPEACYVVIDSRNRRILIHREPRVDTGSGRGGYGSAETVGPGGVVRLSVAGIGLEPIPFERLLP